MKKLRVVITCGGTGGHIYPAISLADALKEIKDAEILFIGTQNHMEANLIPNAGYNFKSCKASGLNGNLISKVLAVFQMFISRQTAKKIIREFNADVVIGFGGYVEAPVVLAASSLNIPVILHEQNSYAGKANLFLEKYAKCVISCYQSVERQFKNKPLLLGNPRTYTAKKKINFDIYQEYNIDKNKDFILIVMGSQGSESVNSFMKESLKDFNDKPYEIVYVTGNKHRNEFVETEYSKNIHFFNYVNQTALMEKASLMITRGGATTASEIGIFKTPSIIIPSPYVPNNHQELNALALVDIEAAYIIREKELNRRDFFDLVDNLMSDPKKLHKMSENASKIGYPNAAEDFIKVIDKYVKSK